MKLLFLYSHLKNICYGNPDSSPACTGFTLDERGAKVVYLRGSFCTILGVRCQYYRYLVPLLRISRLVGLPITVASFCVHFFSNSLQYVNIKYKFLGNKFRLFGSCPRGSFQLVFILLFWGIGDYRERDRTKEKKKKA